MENLKIVDQLFSNLENRNWHNVENLLTEDFTFSGAIPKPINKKEWVNVQRAIQTGIPDLKFNLRGVTDKGNNKIAAKVKLSGTNTEDMPAVLPGTSPMRATGKKIIMPDEDIELTFRGDKISNLNVKSVAHGGVEGILEQIKVKTGKSVKV